MPSIDLTTLTGWSSLSDGSHNITIVAKADGYRDSEHSSVVVVTKATTPTEDELAGTWVFNDSLNISDDITWNVNYTTNYEDYTDLRISLQHSPMGNYPCMGTSKSSVAFYNMGAWNGDGYKTIAITSKLSEVTNGDTLLTWLQASATKQ